MEDVEFTPEKSVMIIVYILVGIFIYFLFKDIVKRVLGYSKNRLSEKQMHHLETIQALIVGLSKYVILLAIILATLATYGVDITSVLAGLGIATAVIGLAFQDMAKDIIAGISIVAQGLFEVGDMVEIDGFKGKVIALGLKTTRIQNWKGPVKIITNRNISEVINYTKTHSVAIVDVLASYEHTPEKVIEALENVKGKLEGKLEGATDEIRVWGVMDLGEDGVQYRISVKTEAYKHFEIQRIFRKEIKDEFAKKKIKIPFKQIVVHKD